MVLRFEGVRRPGDAMPGVVVAVDGTAGDETLSGGGGGGIAVMRKRSNRKMRRRRIDG